MDSKRRDFLKKSAMSAAVGVGAVSALEAREPSKKIKNSSDKKPEILYQETKSWEIFYKNSK